MTKILKTLRSYILLIIIATLLIVIHFKNIRIDNLREEVAKKPKIEYVAKIEKEIITDSIPYPVEVIKWKPSKRDTIYEPLDLTEADSARIADEYLKLYETFAETKIYDNVLKDDTLALVRLKEKVQYNTIFDRELIYEHRTPTVYITNTETIIDKRVSIVGGMSILNGVNLGGGLVTGRNAVYLVNYNPFNNTVGGSVYLPIFNF